MNTEAEQRLLNKIRQLPKNRVVEIEDFVDFLNQREGISLENPLLAQTAPSSRKRKLSEFKGIVEYPFVGEDAQAWVSQSRQLDDAQRDLGSSSAHDDPCIRK